MTKNTLGDMHAILFEELEKLASADESTIESEIKRASAMTGVAAQITKNASTILRYQEYRDISGQDPSLSLGNER